MLFSCDPCNLAAGTTAPHNSNRTPADLGEILGQEEHSIDFTPTSRFADKNTPSIGLRPLRKFTPTSRFGQNSVPDSAYRIKIFQLS